GGEGGGGGGGGREEKKGRRGRGWGSIQPKPFTGLSVPSQLVRICMKMHPITGPINVPRPPMMIQMMICPLTGRLNMVGLTNTELANSRPDRPAIAPPIMKIASL